MTGSTDNQPTAREAEVEIRAYIENWFQAIEAKNAEAVTADYVPDTVLYDAIPPYKTVGAADIRKIYDQCLPCFPESFKARHRDLVVHVDGDVAFAHGICHFMPDQPDHPCGETWMRFTMCFRRTESRWKVVHEHWSIPFNPIDNKAWYITDPDSLSAPDYSDLSEPRTA